MKQIAFPGIKYMKLKIECIYKIKEIQLSKRKYKHKKIQKLNQYQIKKKYKTIKNIQEHYIYTREAVYM